MGEYEGEFLGIEFGYLLLNEPQGTQGHIEEHQWALSPSVVRKASKLTKGDRIIVEVEFNNYTVTNVWGPDSGRMLRGQVELLTKAVAQLAELIQDNIGGLQPEANQIIQQAKLLR